MNYTFQIASEGFICIRNFTNIQVILRLLHQNFERLQCSRNWWEVFMIYTVEMASGGMIYT
jgi:hypothetical protein